jgi:nitrous oxidase accessory protein NosD
MSAVEVEGLTEVGPPWTDVRRFGAKVDGVTDDRAAVLAALTSVAGRGGGIVYVPTGVCLVRSMPGQRAGVPITASNTTLAGDGAGSILRNDVIEPDGDGNGVVAVLADGRAVDNVHVRDVALENFGSRYFIEGAGLGIIYVAGRCGVSGLTVRGCRIVTRNRTGISLGAFVRDFRIIDNDLTGPGETGIYLAGTCLGGFVARNRLGGDYPSDSISIGISVRQCRDTVITSNRIQGYHHSAICVRDNANRNVIISNNLIRADFPGADGIYVGSGEGVTIRGNRIEGVAHNGVSVDSPKPGKVRDITIAENDITAAHAYGVSVSGPAASVVVRGNRLVNCTSGIVVDGVAEYCDVADNLIFKSVPDRNAGLHVAAPAEGCALAVRNNRVRGYVNAIAAGVPVIGNMLE